MPKQLAVTLNTDWVAAGQVITLQVLQTAITAALFGNVDRDHFALNTNPLVTSAGTPTSPAVGLGWVNSASGRLSIWTGSEWLGTGVHVAATAPSASGALWYDTTLEILRFIRVIDGVTGWHPIDSAYQLLVNKSVSPIVAGNVVVRLASGGTPRGVSMTTTVKSTNVAGVAMEDIAVGESGVVATVGGGAIVNVLCDDTATDGAVVIDDGLVTYSVAGEARTVGALETTAFVSSNTRRDGTPIGCFAAALSTKDATTHLVRARLLGYVGQGRRITSSELLNSSISNAAAATTTAWAEVNVATFSIMNTKHLPIAMAMCRMQSLIGQNAGTNRDFLIELGVNIAGPALTTLRHTGALATGGAFPPDVRQWGVDQRTVDDTATPAGLGQKFAWRLTSDAGAINTWTVTLGMYGYLYLALFALIPMLS